MRPSALVSLLLTLLASPAIAAELPITSYPGAPDGVAAPFVGKWSIMKPDGDPTAITDSCGMPAEIIANGTGKARYLSSTGASFDFALSAGKGGTVWDGELPRISVWADTDSFYFYPRQADGSADTNDAYIYQRCHEWPKTSYPGVVAGALEPFVGRWEESVPAARGTQRQVVGPCTDPTVFAIKDEKTLLRTIANQPDRDIPISKRGNDTVSANPIPRYNPSVIIWAGPDRFHFHGIDLYGQTDWNNPVIYIRCPN